MVCCRKRRAGRWLEQWQDVEACGVHDDIFDWFDWYHPDRRNSYASTLRWHPKQPLASAQLNTCHIVGLITAYRP
jgi:hypothetical protein